MTLAYSGAKVQSRFYPGDLVTCTGDWEIRSVSGRLPDYLGELACMLLSQSIQAQTDYTPKHTHNSTITTQGMPTAILQVLFKKEETNDFCKRRKTN